MAKRRKYPAELKATVALEALRGEQTMAEVSARYNVHPNLIANWKRKAWSMSSTEAVRNGTLSTRRRSRNCTRKSVS